MSGGEGIGTWRWLPTNMTPRTSVQAPMPAASGVSLLRLSVPARLVMVAVASALLWGAVMWALR